GGGVRVDAGAQVAALHTAGLQHVRTVGAVPRIGAGGLAWHLLEGGGGGASAVARTPGGLGAAAGAGGEDCGDAAGTEHAERSATGDERAHVEGEALVLEVLGGVVEGAALEGRRRDLCAIRVLCGRCGVLVGGGKGAGAVSADGAVHDGPLDHAVVRWER